MRKSKSQHIYSTPADAVKDVILRDPKTKVSTTLRIKIPISYGIGKGNLVEDVSIETYINSFVENLKTGSVFLLYFGQAFLEKEFVKLVSIQVRRPTKSYKEYPGLATLSFKVLDNLAVMEAMGANQE